MTNIFNRQSCVLLLLVDLPEKSIADVPRAVRINHTHIFVMITVNREGKGKAWLFNRIDQAFQRLPEFIHTRFRPAVGLIERHGIMVAGGVGKKSSEIFDLDTNQWKPVPDFPVAASFYDSVSVQTQDSILIMGGRGFDSGRSDEN